ncbi:MAG: hypothetical protein WC683_01360 [bacterium]
MLKSKQKEFLDANARLEAVLAQREAGLATDADVEEAWEQVVRMKVAKQLLPLGEMMTSCTSVHDNGKHRGHRGPKIGTNLGDLLRDSTSKNG